MFALEVIEPTTGTPAWLQLALTGIITIGSVAAAALAAGVWRRAGATKQAVEEVSAQVKKVDTAVNNVPVGHPTLVQRVETLERRSDALGRWMHDALAAIGGQLGVSLPDRRTYDNEEG